MPPLSDLQTAFIDKYLKVPKAFGRKEVKRKREEWATEFRRFNTLRDGVKQKIDGLGDPALRQRFQDQVQGAEDGILAGKDKPDFDGGHKRLVEIAKDVAAQKVFADCERELNAVRPLAQSLIDTVPQNVAELRMLLSFAEEKYASGKAGGAVDQIKSALAAVEKLRDEMANSVHSVPTAQTGDVQRAKDALLVDADRRPALAALDAEDQRLAAITVLLLATFETNPPPLLEAERKALVLLLGVDRAADPGVIDTAAKAAALRITTLDPKVDTACKDRVAYEDRLSALRKGDLALVSAHRQAAHPVVAPMVQGIKTHVDAAVLAADGHDFLAAGVALGTAETETATALQAADELSEYLDVKADREQRMTAIAGIDVGLRAHLQVETAAKKVEDLWAEITSVFDAPAPDLAKLKSLAPKLSEIPTLVAEATNIAARAKQYDEDFADVEDYPDDLEAEITGFGVTAKAVVQAMIDRLRAQIDSAELASATDFRTAASLVSGAASFGETIEAKVSEVQAMDTAKTAFEARQTEVTDKDATTGAAALIAYRTRLTNDALHATDRASKGEFAMATKTYTSSEAGHAALLATYALAQQYFDDRLALEQRLTAVKNSGGTTSGAAHAAEVNKAVQAALDAAHAARLANSWQWAVDLLPEVETQLAIAERAAKNGEIFETGADPAAVAAVDTDRDAAFAAFDSAISNVAVLGMNKGKYSSLAKQAAAFRPQADAAMKSIPADPAAARVALTAGIDICRRLFRLDVEAASYDNLRGLVKEGREVVKSNKLNKLKYFNDQMTEVDRLLKAAEQDTASPGFDFAAGGAKLAQARAEIQAIYDGFQAVIDVTRKRERIEDTHKQIDDLPDVKPLMGQELARLTDILAAIDKDLEDGKPQDAEAKADDGLKERTFMVTQARECISYVDARKTVLDVKETALGELAKLYPMSTTLAANAKKEVDNIKQRIQAAIDARSFLTADWLVYSARDAVEVAYTAARAGGAYADRLGIVEPALTKLDQRLDPANVPLADGIAKLKLQLADAKEMERVEQFASAYKRLAGMQEAIAALEPLAKAHEDYKAALKSAEESLDLADRLPNTISVAPLLARARAAVVLGKDLATNGEYTVATETLLVAGREAAEAIRTAGEMAEYRNVTDALVIEGSEADPTGEALETAIRQATMLVDDLKGRDESLFVFGDVLAADAALADARKLAPTDAKGAQAELATAMTHCADARRNIGLYAQLRASEQQARDRIEALLAEHPQAAFVRDDLEAQLARLEAPMNAVRRDPGQMPAAETAIADVVAQFHRLRRVADAQVEVAALQADLTPEIARMEKHGHRYAIAAEATKIKADAETARGLAKAHDQAGAVALLKAARISATEALLKADMQSGAAPDQAMLKAILARPDGPAALDKLVKTLDDATKKKVMVEVFKARFGCELVLYKTESTSKYVQSEMEKFRTANPKATERQLRTKEQELTILDRSQNLDMNADDRAPDVLRFYDEMAKLPPADTLTNDSLKIFTSKGESQGSFFSQRRREVVMVEASGGDNYYSVGEAGELEDVDALCTPEPGEDLTFFSWNTLHEVGHAVDDKMGYMKRNANKLAGWTDYGRDVIPIADAVSKAFKLDNVAFAAAYLKRTIKNLPDGSEDPAESEKVQTPPTPANVPADEWVRRLADAAAYMDRIRVDKTPWQTSGSAAASALGAICYQESYDASWTSYPLAERKKGVTGYQFRAPGEWFSELYAAFHSGKMNKSHPARVWLATLQDP